MDLNGFFLALTYLPWRRTFWQACCSFPALQTLSFRQPLSVLLLFRFSVQGMLFAETAVLVHLKSVGRILLVLHCVVVALFALCAS